MAETAIDTALTEASLSAATDAAEQAFMSAADLDALAAAKTEHLGGKAPIALAQRALGSLPKDQKADAGKRVNVARWRTAPSVAPPLAAPAPSETAATVESGARISQLAGAAPQDDGLCAAAADL